MRCRSTTSSFNIASGFLKTFSSNRSSAGKRWERIICKQRTTEVFIHCHFKKIAQLHFTATSPLCQHTAYAILCNSYSTGKIKDLLWDYHEYMFICYFAILPCRVVVHTFKVQKQGNFFSPIYDCCLLLNPNVWQERSSSMRFTHFSRDTTEQSIKIHNIIYFLNNKLLYFQHFENSECTR